MKMKLSRQQRIINSIRKNILEMMHRSKSSHIGSCMSIVEILYTLYYRILNIDPKHPEKPDRDKLILSKAHASAALYSVLAEKGFFPKEYLDSFYMDGGILPGHLDKEKIAGVEISAGSLGHGLPIGIGMAISNRMDQIPGKIFVIIGDGECNEGSVWEAAMLAPSLKLNNITVIIDKNNLQGMGYTSDIINQKNLAKQWMDFGWFVLEGNGHDPVEMEKLFQKKSKKPKLIIANTVKGKGVSFMENKLEWHYKSPDQQQLKRAIAEIGECDYEENVC